MDHQAIERAKLQEKAKRGIDKIVVEFKRHKLASGSPIGTHWLPMPSCYDRLQRSRRLANLRHDRAPFDVVAHVVWHLLPLCVTRSSCDHCRHYREDPQATSCGAERITNPAGVARTSVRPLHRTVVARRIASATQDPHRSQMSHRHHRLPTPIMHAQRVRVDVVVYCHTRSRLQP